MWYLICWPQTINAVVIEWSKWKGDSNSCGQVISTAFDIPFHRLYFPPICFVFLETAMFRTSFSFIISILWLFFLVNFLVMFAIATYKSTYIANHLTVCCLVKVLGITHLLSPHLSLSLTHSLFQTKCIVFFRWDDRKGEPEQQQLARKENKYVRAARKIKTTHLPVIISEAETATNKCAILPFDRRSKFKVLFVCVCISILQPGRLMAHVSFDGFSVSLQLEDVSEVKNYFIETTYTIVSPSSEKHKSLH